MKKIIIPFSLDEYNKGGYEVETRGSNLINPHKVRIVCIDRKYEYYPILALISYETVEDTACYGLDGRYIDLKYDYQDLFLVKQEFEDGDIIADNEGNVAIFKNYTKENKFSFYVELFCSKLYFDNEDIIDNCHLASEREKQKLFVALEKEGKHWNA